CLPGCRDGSSGGNWHRPRRDARWREPDRGRLAVAAASAAILRIGDWNSLGQKGKNIGGTVGSPTKGCRRPSGYDNLLTPHLNVRGCPWPAASSLLFLPSLVRLLPRSSMQVAVS